MKTVTKESKGIAIEVFCEDETTPIEGNAWRLIHDAETVSWIKRQLRHGNEWAWCSIHVRVTYKGTLTGDDYLGCCSYKSEADFVGSKFRIESPDGTVTHSGYYDDMVDECLSQINAKLAALCSEEV